MAKNQEILKVGRIHYHSVGLGIRKCPILADFLTILDHFFKKLI